VRDAGFRVICPDLVGFGRSDKPVDPGWYSYDRHVELAATLLEDLDLRDATFVVHDWGGPIGLRLAVEHPDRVSRLVMMDTGLFNGRQEMGEAWHTFRRFAERTEDLPTGFLVARGVVDELPEAVVAAYDKPYPDPASKAGARVFPGLIPLSPDAPGAEAGARVMAALREDTRPKLVLWGAQDPVLPLERGEAFAAAIGAGPVQPVEGAGHYLQEDRGPEVGAMIADWLTSP
jgi:haloalkane dehalogenase